MIVALVLASVFGAGCSDSTGTGGTVANQNFLAEAALSIDLDATGRVGFTVDGVNGNIDVVGVSGTEQFQIRGERRVRSESVADAEAYLDRVQVDVTEIGNAIFIRTIQPDNTGGRNVEVNYRLTVPRRLGATLVSVNGNASVAQMDGVALITQVNGNVLLDTVTDAVSVSLVNGNIDCRATMASGGSVVLETVNGNLELSLPQTVSATFSARVVNGNITTASLPLQNVVNTPTSVTGTLGGGAGTISLRTTNGNILATGF